MKSILGESFRAGIGIMAAAIMMALGPGVGNAAAEPAAVDPAAIDGFIADYLAHTRLPGVAIAVTHGDQIVRATGYGHDSSGTDLTGATKMPIASLSKSFTSAAVLQLVDAGKVDLDSPVRHYVPEFWMKDSRADRITVRQLLNQTSGMSDRTFPDIRMPVPNSLAAAVERLHTAELATDPGTAFHYHNPNFQVAARVVEVVSGIAFADYMTERVFKPLGMNSTSTVNDTTAASDLTHGYIRAYGLPFAAGEPDVFVGGSHGVLTTAADMTRWLMAQNDQGRIPGGGRLLSPASTDAMHTPSKISDYAMGWFSRKTDSGAVELVHTGEWFTYTAEQVLLPESDYGIVVMVPAGTQLQDEPAIITNGLIALVSGAQPEVKNPAGFRVDWVLAALTVLTIVLGVLGFVRARRWAAKQSGRAVWAVLPRQVPYVLPVVALALAPNNLTMAVRGRASTFEIMCYVMPALMIWLGIAALLGVGLIIVRTILWVRQPGSSATVPSSPMAPGDDPGHSRASTGQA